MTKLNINYVYIIFFTIFFWSCNKRQEEKIESENKITFDITKANDLDLANAKHLKKRIIELSSDSIIIPAYTNMLINKDEFILYSQKTYQIFRFDSEGNFINFIGKRGGGPNEFTEMRDVILNNNTIEILDFNAILRYQLNGEFIEKINIIYPAFSFARENKNYWFYVGNNPTFSKFKLVETDTSFLKVNEYFPIDEKGIPLIENNFGMNYYITYRESLSPNLYRLNKKLENSYYIDFGKFKIPDAIASSDPMHMNEKLDKIEYAIIREYMENTNYTFLLIFKYEPNTMMPQLFYWIINKKNKEERIIHIKDFIEESYLLFPQIISNNDTIFFIGYDTGNENEQVDQNSNPSIIEIKIEDLFNYGI